MRKPIAPVFMALFFVVATFAVPNVLAIQEDFLKQLLNDKSYGNLNRLVAKEIGNTVSAERLGVEIGKLNDMARKAKLSENEVLTKFKDALKETEKRRLEPIFALTTTTQSIAFGLAYQDTLKTGNDAEKLYRAAEKKVMEAESAHMTSNGMLELSGGMTKIKYKVETWTLKNNKARVEDTAILLPDNMEFKSGRISDGDTWWENPPDKKVTVRKKTPANLHSALTGAAMRGGVSLGYAWVESSGFDKNDLLDRIKLTQFVMGKKEKVGEREAQMIGYKVEYGKPTLSVQLWLDTETNLPVKRFVSEDQKNGTTWAETCEFRVNVKIDPKLLERPK